MISLAAGFFGVFGGLSLVGGVIGFKKAGSRASLIAGSIAGAALFAASALTFSGALSTGLSLGGGTSLLLAARFVPTYLKSKKVMPHGLMALFSILGTLVSVAAFIK